MGFGEMTRRGGPEGLGVANAVLDSGKDTVGSQSLSGGGEGNGFVGAGLGGGMFRVGNFTPSCALAAVCRECEAG